MASFWWSELFFYSEVENILLLFHLFTPATTFLSPLNPKSDQNLISPYSNISESFNKIMRIKEMIAN